MSNTSNNRQSKQALPEGWREVRLGELGKIITGKTPPTKDKCNYGDEYMFITPRDMDKQKYIKATERMLSKKGFDLLENNQIPKKSICISCIGSMGKVLITTQKCATNQQINSIIVEDEMPEYIYYDMLIRQPEIKKNASGSVVPILNKSSFSNFKINLPPLPEQKAIANILGSLDDKIELNRQMNETLEEMAQALFKSWFVDFDPVYAKAILNTTTQSSLASLPEGSAHKKWSVERAKNYLATLPQEVSDLFPSEFEHHKKMGWIPKGWEMKTIADMGSIVCGKTPSKSVKENYGGNIPFIKIPNMHNEIYVMQTDEYLTDLGVKAQKNKTIPQGSIAVSCIATVGKVVLTHEICHTNQQINNIIPREKYYQYYLYFYMLSLNEHFHNLASTGSATLNMNTSTFSKINILIPSDALLQEYNFSVKKYFKNILNNQMQNQTLTQLRDTLLSKLISGRIRIKDIEKYENKVS